MIIWGSKGKEKTMESGQFLCPCCRCLRPYKHKKISKYFTLYFIPLFETKNLGEYIECQVCGSTWKMEVLEQGRILEQELRIQEQATQTARLVSSQMESGVSLQQIASSLETAGTDGKVIGAALTAATGGKLRVCHKCKLSYGPTLRYCSTCGGALADYSD
jgi:hypothetical protein